MNIKLKPLLAVAAVVAVAYYFLIKKKGCKCSSLGKCECNGAAKESDPVSDPVVKEEKYIGTDKDSNYLTYTGQDMAYLPSSAKSSAPYDLAYLQ